MLNANLAIEDRVNDLIDRMDLDEKVAQLGAVEFPHLITGERFDDEAALAVVPHGIGQVTRIGATTGLEPQQSAELFNQIQHLVVERTRLGIPVMVHEESLAGYCAGAPPCSPRRSLSPALGIPALVHDVADCVRRQLLAVGARHSLAPVLDVARDPRWGRLEETYGEDPVLAGVLGTAYVRGMQTDDLTRGVLATGKHFLAHGAIGGWAQPCAGTGRAEGAAGGVCGALRRRNPRRRVGLGHELVQLRRRASWQRVGGDPDALAP